MVSPVPPSQNSDLGWLLSNLVERVPHTRSTVLLSADGLTKAVYGMDTESAEQLAAIASGLFSLARGTGARFGGSDGVRQVVVELDDTMLFVSSAGFGSVLAVLAGREADAGVLGYEMSQLIKSVRPFLGTPARSAPAARPATTRPSEHGGL
ncbi:putative regulator of Ras-like GTPase activity (Roadblock/LC7/MglB family) [Lipingzhangella halophila]|uniref:Putative regulator of Ras-like GTPase activity (Roadblock/LC7/MglB family) n=1 Tax=Lipingzhangella halophila TaxID=1783352 RepID=A0A7W7RM47_9ACTN|nr:roadblock/LC7 domain-containing protein [Lipingzhangella halophila]MBB4934535.1 putative regulator of Ras-like GTPase activity (Roadblock/LC7/MglB family) [Lipingzhangella halophila]